MLTVAKKADVRAAYKRCGYIEACTDNEEDSDDYDDVVEEDTADDAAPFNPQTPEAHQPLLEQGPPNAPHHALPFNPNTPTGTPTHQPHARILGPGLSVVSVSLCTCIWYIQYAHRRTTRTICTVRVRSNRYAFVATGTRS